MADNNLKIQANVEMPSAKQINNQIKALEKKLNRLTISGQFDASALKSMTKQLDSIKTTVSTAAFSPTALKTLTGQVEKAMSSVKTPDTPISNIQNKISSLKKSLESFKSLSVFQNIGKCRISIRISKSVKCFEYALLA